MNILYHITGFGVYSVICWTCDSKFEYHPAMKSKELDSFIEKCKEEHGEIYVKRV